MRLRVLTAVCATLALGGCGPCDDSEPARPAALAVGHADGVLDADTHGDTDAHAVA